jgi:hypothetical protein
MTEEQWVLSHAVSVEQYHENWHNLVDRVKFNRMNGDQQFEYEKRLRAKADKPHFRAWSARDTFYDITRSTYELARDHGIPIRANG